MIKMNSYLNFPGNAEAAFRFYPSVFGGELASLVRFKDMPMADQQWGDYFGSLKDKYGILWMVSFTYPKPE